MGILTHKTSSFETDNVISAQGKANNAKGHTVC